MIYKRIYAFLLAVLMTVSSVPFGFLSVSAADLSAEQPAGESVSEELLSGETAPEETVPEETVPGETIPEATAPEETAPEETAPEATAPEATVPEETVSEETISGETFSEEPFPAEPLFEETIPCAGLIPDDFTPPYGQVAGAAMSALPPLYSTYDSRQKNLIPPIRDQGNWELCWAFSALGTAESQLIASGQSDLSIDLSERHLAHYFQGDAYDPLGNTAGDGTYLFSNYLTVGGNNKFTTFALANWVGPAEESRYPYREDPGTDTPSGALDDVAHLSNAYWINTGDSKSIKYYIMRNGSVSISMYYLPAYYNAETCAFYNPDYTVCNHALTVVGWDDDYPAENFLARPASDGAWLCRNTVGSDFGDHGYFWLSYYDKSLTGSGATAFAFEFEDSRNYDWNYHYDGSYGTATSVVDDFGSIAAIFETSGNGMGDELLEAVGVAFADANVEYSIQVYRGLTDPQDPTSGTAVFSIPQTGVSGLAGYYTLPLCEPVLLSCGERFSVVLTLASQSGDDVRFFTDASYTNGAWIQFVNQCSAGQTFLQNPGMPWTDLFTWSETARIKAYTSNAQTRTPSGIAFAEAVIQLSCLETFRQSPVFIPETATPCSLTWTSSDPSVATVQEDGTVFAVAPGQAVITATSLNGYLSASYTVRVDPPLTAVQFRRTRAEMLCGTTFTPEVIVIPSTSADYYPVVLTSSDPGVAAVENGVVVAISAGRAVITASAGNKSTSYHVTVTQSLDAADIRVEPAFYTGTPVCPEVSVSLNDAALVKDEDYTLTYWNNSVPGIGSVRIQGIGLYSGFVTREFPVALDCPTLSSAENEAQGIRLTWTPAEGADGYVIYRKSNQGSWKTLKRLASTVGPSYLDKSASNSGSTYQYRIAAYLKKGKTTYTGDRSDPLTVLRLRPSGITAITATDSGFRLAISPVNGATAYWIYRSSSVCPEVILLDTVSHNGKTLYFDDVARHETGVQYHYTVVPEAATETGRWTGPVSARRSAVIPDTPRFLSVSNGAGGIVLSWEHVKDAYGYEIYRSQNGGNWKKVKTITNAGTTIWTNKNVSSGHTYSYQIRAVAKLTGSLFSGSFSEDASVVRLNRASIASVSQTEDGILIKGGKTAKAQCYVLYRSEDGAEPVAIFESKDSSALRYLDADIAEDCLYSYTIRARIRTESGFSDSFPSASKEALIPAQPVITSVQSESRGMRISWTASGTQDGFYLYRQRTNGSWTKIKTLSGTATSYLDTASRKNGMTYTYKIQPYTKVSGRTFTGIFSEWAGGTK